MKSAKGENRIKRLYVHRAVEKKQPRTMTEPFNMAVLSPQDGETADVFSCFSAEGLYTQAFYWVIPLGFQKRLCYRKWLMFFP